MRNDISLSELKSVLLFEAETGCRRWPSMIDHKNRIHNNLGCFRYKKDALVAQRQAEKNKDILYAK